MSSLQKQNIPEHLCRPEGFIGDVVRHMERTAEFNCLEFFLAAAIAALSVLIGRKVEDYRGTRPNVYVVCIGPTGCGKEHPRKEIQSLLSETDLVIADKFTGESAMATQLLVTPSGLSLCDEFGRYIEASCKPNVTGPAAEVATTMMTLFSTTGTWKPKCFADSKKSLSIESPCLSVYGSTTPSTFFGGLSGGEVSSGFVGRLLLFLSPGGGYVRRQDFEQAEIPANLKDFVSKWQTMQCGEGNLSSVNPTPRRLDVSAEALERLNGHFNGISDRRIGEDVNSAAIWSRTAEKTSRLALLAAVSRDSDTIEIQDAEWAIALANFLTRRAIALIGGNVASTPHEANVQKMLQLFESSNGVLSVAELGQKSRWLKARDRKEILVQLVESGDLIQVIRTTPGRQANGFASSMKAVNGTQWIAVTAELLRASKA